MERQGEEGGEIGGGGWRDRGRRVERQGEEGGETKGRRVER